MTRSEIVNAVLGRRFPSATQLTNARRWVDTAYQDVWGAADWTFKRVPISNFTVSSAQPTMPTDFADVIELYDPQGYRLNRLSEEDFENSYLDALVSGSSGSADAYMVTNRQVYLSQPSSGTYKLSYTRRMAHKDTGGSVVAGPMSVDTDKPLWDDHHAILIPRATVLGLIELNDPSWQSFQEEYERQLSRMKSDYEQVRPAKQWGKVW